MEFCKDGQEVIKMIKVGLQFFGGRGASSGGKSGGVQSGKPNAATEWYVSGEGMWINQYLRGRGEFSELTTNEKQMLKDLDIATNGKITDKTLYRSVDASAIFGNMSEGDYADLSQALIYGKDSFGKGKFADGIREKIDNRINRTEGKTITEKGFMSTTTSAEVAENWMDFTGSEKPVVMKITTSKNTKGVNLSGYDKNVSKSEAQHERLLARNQSYDVKKIYGKNGTIYVDVTMK